MKMTSFIYLLICPILLSLSASDPIDQSVRIDKHVVAFHVLPDFTEEDLTKVKAKLYKEALIELKIEKVKTWPFTPKLRWVSFTVETLEGHQGHYEGPVSTKERQVGFYLARDDAFEKKLGSKFGVGILPNGIFE